MTSSQQLYNSGNYEECFTQLYKEKNKVKVFVWSLIILFFILDIVVFILLKVIKQQIESGDLFVGIAVGFAGSNYLIKRICKWGLKK